MDLTFIPWTDPLVESRGFPADSPYVRLFWLPVLGPTATLLFQALNFDFTYLPDGVTESADQFSCSLGLGLGFGRNAPLRRAVERCIRFGVMKQIGPAEYAVRQFVSSLTEHHLSQLTPSLRQLHEAYRSETAFESK